MPLIPCLSVVIAASETGVSTKTGISAGSVLVINGGFNWSTSSCEHSRQGIRRRISGISSAAAKMFKTATDTLGLSGMTMYQTRHSQHRSGARFQNSARSAKMRVVESVQHCHKIQHKQPSGGRLPLSPAPAPRQAGNTRATCRCVADKATASPAVHKRMTGKFLLDVFGGSGFLTKATHHLGLRGYVLDTKFALRYDVTQPLVLTRIRQDVSAGKCVAGTISPPRHSKSYFRQCGHRKLASACSHALDSGTPV